MAKKIARFWDVENRTYVNINTEKVVSTKQAKAGGLFTKAHTEINLGRDGKICVEGKTYKVNEQLGQKPVEFWEVENNSYVYVNAEKVVSTKQVKSGGLFSKAHTEISMGLDGKIIVEGGTYTINKLLGLE